MAFLYGSAGRSTALFGCFRPGQFKAACPNTPIIVMPKGAHHCLDALAAIEAIDVIGLDWTVPASQVRSERASSALQTQCVQGNIDPAFLMSEPAAIEAAVKDMIDGFTTDGMPSPTHPPHAFTPIPSKVRPEPTSPTGIGYIGNVGNGLLTTTPVEGVATMVNAIQRWRPAGQETLRIGTRASALALVQARWCARRLKAQHPKLNIDIVEIKALGDKPPSGP
jgi:hypothetical protein